ncbi:MAG: hypothetical protein GX901_03955 [Lentisphaerae bacterium]|nr:hypothetical protein [Lentisphaerota bacterium]
MLRYCLLILLFSAWSLSAQEKCRGNFLRSELRKTEKQELYLCTLSSRRDSFPSLFLRRQLKMTYHEVQIYETLERTLLEADEAALKTVTSYQYKLLPGELWEGETLMRQETVEAGPFANEGFLVDGKLLHSDQQGIIKADYSSGLRILEYFDDFSKRELELRIEHGGLGSQTLTIFRSMPKRPQSDERNLDEDYGNELLSSMKLDFLQRSGEPERQKLRVECFFSCPEIEPGKDYAVTITVSNQGDKESSCLLARSFSRQSWLNGRLFYLGAIAPGKSLSFTRQFTAPESLKTQHCFVALAFSDSWGELPRMQKNLKLPVKK